MKHFNFPIQTIGFPRFSEKKPKIAPENPPISACIPYESIFGGNPERSRLYSIDFRPVHLNARDDSFCAFSILTLFILYKNRVGFL